MIHKPNFIPKISVNEVNTGDEVSLPLQKLVASSIDEGINATFNNKLEPAMSSYFDKRIDAFMNSKFGSSMADLPHTSVASTSQAPVNQIFSNFDGVTMQQTGEGNPSLSAGLTGQTYIGLTG